MSFSLQSKVIIITGASTGIGAAIAKICAQKRAKVVLFARTKETLDTLSNEITAAGGTSFAVQGDVREAKDVDRLVRETVDRWGGIDVLINNAGFGVRGVFKDVSLEAFRQNFETNFFAALACTKAVLPFFYSQGEGMIVNIESLVGLRSVPGFSSYAASKHALHACSEALMIELALDNIHVMSVCPGLIKTPFSKNRLQIGPVTARTPDWMAMPVDKCAAQIVRAMEKQKRRVLITRHAKILWFLQRFSPTLVDWILSQRFGKTSKRQI